MDDANREAVEAWDTVLFDKFTRFRHLLTTGLRVHGDRALALHPPRPGSAVLDVGCGFGDTTLDLVATFGAGHAVGVDCSPRFIRAARADATASRAVNVAFQVRDAQGDPLGGPYDYVFSRFGVMFFAGPVAAFRNLRRHLRPGGSATFVVWRRREDNPWLHVAERCVNALLPPGEERDEVTCGPGPFSMAGDEVVREQLGLAGYESVTITREDHDICIGRDLEEAVEFSLALGPGGEALRLAGGRAESIRPALAAALRAALAPFCRDDGVRAPSSTWVMHAVA